MPSYADDDLISLADSSAEEGSVTTGPALPEPVILANKMAAKHRQPAQRDSFSELASLMKLKKSYTPVVSSAPGSALSTTANSELRDQVVDNDDYQSLGMRFASAATGSKHILSPLARPYHTDGSVAAYLQEQARSPIDTVSSDPEYRQRDMQRLESMLQEMEAFPVDDNDIKASCQSFHHQPMSAFEPLIPGFEFTPAFPTRTESISSPTPAISTQPTSLEEPIVRVSMHVWESMGRELDELKREKQSLETKIARSEKSQQTPTYQADCNDELQTQIGKLQYQSEYNRTQKAKMARSLSEKDLEIKALQLEVANIKETSQSLARAAKEYTDIVTQLQYHKTALENEKTHSLDHLTRLTSGKNSEIKVLSETIAGLKEELKHANAKCNEYRNNDEIDDLTCRFKHNQKMLHSMQEKYAAEHTKVGDLEDHVEDLQRKLSQVGDIQSMLREKSSECDRFRTQLRNQTKHLDDSKQRILRASRDGAALRGAVHLVKPSANAKLPTLVLGCTECYAKNISCDNKARCQNCTENNEQCARLRCSLKHILTFCPTTPCQFPHDQDGWLCQAEPRPEW